VNFVHDFQFLIKGYWWVMSPDPDPARRLSIPH